MEPETCPTFAKNGDKWMKKGSFARALRWYQAAGYQKLIDFGDRCLEEGGYYYDLACRAYALAGAAIPADKLVAFGERCLVIPEYAAVALKVFQAAGDPAKVRVAAEKCLEMGHLDIAREIYAAAGEEMPADKLRACGDACIKSGHADKAREAYRLALANGS